MPQRRCGHKPGSSSSARAARPGISCGYGALSGLRSRIVAEPVVGLLAEAVQAATGDSVELAYVDQGYTGETAETAAAEHGLKLEVVKLPEAKRGFVLLPRRWVVERSFAWATRFRRLVRDYERLPQTLKGLHFAAFACLMLNKAVAAMLSS